MVRYLYLKGEEHLLRNDLIVGILMLFFGRPPLIVIIRPPDWTFLSDSITIATHKGLFYYVEEHKKL